MDSHSIKIMISKIFINEVSIINGLGLHNSRVKFAKVDTSFIL